MPVAQGGPPPARQALTVGAAALLGILAIVFLVTRFDQLGGSSGSTVELGDPVFQFGQASEFAPLIAEEGPLLLPDAASGERDIWLQHLGDETDSGWVAFSARADGAPRECFVEWQADSETFADACDGATYPADGEGLAQYAVSVDPDGDLRINLNPLDDPE